MKKLYLIHHLGLGDHILCNGVYRNFAKQFDLCAIPVKQRNLTSVSHMLSDLKNVHIIGLEDAQADALMLQQETHYKMLGFDIIKLGYYGKNFLNTSDVRYDASFYSQADLDFDKRWSDFYYPRDKEIEYNLFKKICGDNIKEGEYIFLHEDVRRGFKINRVLIKEDYPIITPGLNKQHTLGSTDDARFFDYGYIIENAAAIHCIESSFAAFIEGMELSPTLPKYAHRYARPEASNDLRMEFSYKTKWNILT